MIAKERCGCYSGQGLVIICSATTDCSHRRIVTCDCKRWVIREENGNKKGILSDYYRTRILGIAIAPLLKMVVFVRDSGNDCRGIIAIKPWTRDGAARSVIACDSDIRIVRYENGRDGGIWGERDEPGIWKIAIAPPQEMEIVIGHSHYSSKRARASRLLEYYGMAHSRIVHI